MSWKKNQKDFRVEKVITRKGSKLYVKWKTYDSSYNGWIDRKKTIWMGEYFSELKSLGERVKVELDLFTYATKEDLKNTAGFDTSKFTINLDLASL